MTINLSAALQTACPEGQENTVGEMGRPFGSSVGFEQLREERGQCGGDNKIVIARVSTRYAVSNVKTFKNCLGGPGEVVPVSQPDPKDHPLSVFFLRLGKGEMLGIHQGVQRQMKTKQSVIMSDFKEFWLNRNHFLSV